MPYIPVHTRSEVWFLCMLHFVGNFFPSGYFSQMSKWAPYLTRALVRLFDLNQVSPPPQFDYYLYLRTTGWGDTGENSIWRKNKNKLFSCQTNGGSRPKGKSFCSHWRRIFPVKFRKFRGIVAVDFVWPFYFPWSAFKTRLPRSNFLLLFFGKFGFVH